VKHNRTLGLALGVLVLGAAAFYSAPYLVLWRMRGAVERGDAAAISAHVNFPLLRENLKGSLSAAMTQRSERQSSAGVSAFGALLAGAIVEPMVDAMVTPEAVAKMMRGQKPTQNGAAALPTELATDMGYEDLSTFVVTTKRPEQPDGVSAVFTRDGLSWKLSAVRLPI